MEKYTVYKKKTYRAYFKADQNCTRGNDRRKEVQKNMQCMQQITHGVNFKSYVNITRKAEKAPTFGLLKPIYREITRGDV